MPDTFTEVADATTLAYGENFPIRLLLLEHEAQSRGHFYASQWYRRQVGTDGRLNDALLASLAAYHAAMAAIDLGAERA